MITVRPCTCLGTCRGAAGLAVGWYCVLDTGKVNCPNCYAQMPAGQSGHCPNCDHENDGACTCDHCLMAEPYEEDGDDGEA